jgi:hypothetical protein
MTIINEQASFDAQVAVIINNLTNPAANSGWMTTVNDNGQTANVPAFTITPSVPGINNSLLPSSSQTGVTFSCAMAVSDISDSSTSVSFNGGAGIEVDLDFLVFAGAETSVSYNASTFNENAASINATMTFDGVTAVSIIPAAYNSSSNIGWWEPDFISQAANGSSSVSGPQMIPASNYNLGANGNFGVVNEIFISQMPTFSLVYQSTDISGFQEALSTDTSWGVSFLGIPLCGGSTTTNYSASAEQTSATEITITMTPPVGGVAVSANDQLANVIGATMVWPGQAN